MKEMRFLFCIFSLLSLQAISQRNSLNRGRSPLVPDYTVLSISGDQYKSFLSTHVVIDSSQDQDYALVQRVGSRIIVAAKSYYHNKKTILSELSSYAWEIKLIGKKEVNTWCMPGGKMAVYSGLLPVTQSEASLAVLLGHTTAHMLIKHGNERMKQYLQDKLNGKILAESLSANPDYTKELFRAAYGMGTNAGIWIPYSKEDEQEADNLGLIFCGLAGYNPREALVLWGRMARFSHSAQEPELLATHHVYGERMTRLTEIMDEMVRDYYNPSIKN